MIEKALFTLLSDATITAIATAGVFRQKAPQGTGYPQVTFNILEDPDEYHMAGVDRLRTCAIDVRSRAKTAAETDQLKTAIYNKLNAYNGTVGGVEIQLITFEGSAEATENPADGSEDQVNVVSQDFEVKYFGTSP